MYRGIKIHNRKHLINRWHGINLYTKQYKETKNRIKKFNYY